MKKMLGMIILTILFFAPLVVSGGCSNTTSEVGMDWHSEEVQKAEHDRRYPTGHSHLPGPKGENCTYNERNEVYLCQFDWFE